MFIDTNQTGVSGNDQEESVIERVFLCPFNQYHKFYDVRKYKFHIAKCKDRRGHSIYHCRYVHDHIFCTPEAIKAHEESCPNKYDMPAGFHHNFDENRAPSATYCKYNVAHCFRSLQDREEHEKTCPNKAEFERKYAQSQQVYQKLKPELKAIQQKRKEQMVDYLGSHNGPQSRHMPHLSYKYAMNEPFVGGEAARYQDSHQQIEFKKRSMNSISDPSPSPTPSMKLLSSLKDQKPELLSKKEEGGQLLCTQANSLYELEERFADEGAIPDVGVFTVRQDGEELFNLQVQSRANQCMLFDMEIEEYLPFNSFMTLAQIDEVFSQTYDWQRFVQTNCVLKLNINREEDEKYSRTLATQFYEKFCTAMQNAQQHLRLTFAVNKTHFSATDQANEQTILILISHNSEKIGAFIDSDFAVLQISTSSQQNPQVNQNASVLKQINQTPRSQIEQHDLDQRLTLALSETSELKQSAIINEKLLKDYERQTRQDKSGIKFLEGEVKRVRGEVQDLKNLLDQKELQTKNLKSDLENQQCDLKSLEARFAKQYRAAELCQEQLNKKKVELEKAMTLLTQANKAIKHKESQVKQAEDRVKELEKYVRQVQNIDNNFGTQNQGVQQEELSFGAIVSLPSNNQSNNQQIGTSQDYLEANQQSCEKSERSKIVENPADDQKQIMVESKTKSEFDHALMEDAEILGDDNDAEALATIKLNKIQQQLDQAFLSGQRAANGLCSAECSKLKDHAGKCQLDKTLPPNDTFEQMCIICQDAPRSVLIQKCRHLVFCERCSNEYALKNHKKKECPICRVEYAKTITVLFS